MVDIFDRDGDGNAAQVRMVAEQIASAFAQRARPEVPAPLKWAGGILAAIATALATAFTVWMATTLADTQTRTVRIEEQQRGANALLTQTVAQLDRRVGTLEEIHREDQRRETR